MNDQVWHGLVQYLNIGTPGGLMGEVLAQRSLGYWIGHAGAGIVFIVLMVIAVIRMLDLHLIDLCKQLCEWSKTLKMEAPTAEEVTAPVEKPKRKRSPRKPKVAADSETKGKETPVNIQQMVADQQAATEAKKGVKEKKKTVPVVEKSAWEKPKKDWHLNCSIGSSGGDMASRMWWD